MSASTALPHQAGSAPQLDSTALRGLAILGIFLHNFAHLLPGIVMENEYSFVAKHPAQLLYQLQHPTSALPLHLISFFGHYGVPLFLFLSAYGLERKYATSDKPAPVGRFILSHYAKLWVMMILGFVPFFALDMLRAENLWTPWENLLPRLAMVNTLTPYAPNSVTPGPYWYFALMLQVYIVYRLFLFRRPWPWAVGMLVLCQLAQYLVAENNLVLMWLRYNFVGSMLPFVLGLLYARYGKAIRTFQALLLPLLSLVGIFAGSFFFTSWLWVPALVCIAGISLLELLPQLLLRPLAWMGGISSAIFVFHPLTRQLIRDSLHTEPYLSISVYAVATLLLAWLLQPLINRATSWVARRLA